MIAAANEQKARTDTAKKLAVQKKALLTKIASDKLKKQKAIEKAIQVKKDNAFKAAQKKSAIAKRKASQAHQQKIELEHDLAKADEKLQTIKVPTPVVIDLNLPS